MRLRCWALSLLAVTVCGTLAVAAAGALGDGAPEELLPVEEVAEVGSAAVSPVEEAGAEVTGTVADLTGAVEDPGSAEAAEATLEQPPALEVVVAPVVDAVVDNGGVSQPIDSAVETVTGTAGGAVESAGSSVTDAVAPVVETGTQAATQAGAGIAGATEPDLPVVDEPPGADAGTLPGHSPVSSNNGPPAGNAAHQNRAGEISTAGGRDAAGSPSAGGRPADGERDQDDETDTTVFSPTGFPATASVPGGGTVLASAGTVDDLLAWQALCWMIFSGDPFTSTTTLLSLLGGRGELADGPGSAARIDANVASSSSDPSVAADRQEIVARPFPDDSWSIPFALVDPRESPGVVLFAVLGFGALCFAMAGVPRRVYAGLRLSDENAFALRLTLGLAGVVLLTVVAIAQLAG